jgi:hypothetical protein
MPVTDTSSQAAAVQFELYTRLDSAAHVAIAAEMSDALRVIAAEGIRRRQPGLTDAEVADALLVLFYGPLTTKS